MRLRLRNTGDVVDEYRFEPVGEVAPWTTVEPETLRLYPGTTGTVELTFAPPRSPDAAAGPTPYAVRITPTEHPEAVVVPEGNVTVLPFTEVRAELVPPVVKGRLRGRSRLAVDNLGNAPLTASLTGSDSGDQLGYELQPGNVRIEPGRAAFVKVTLRPKEISWLGGKQERPYGLAVLRSGTEPLRVEGMFHQSGFLPRWLAGVLGMFVAAAVAFALLWITHDPGVISRASERTTEAANVIDPPPSDPPTVEPPPSQEPEPEVVTPDPPVQQEPEDDSSGGGGGGEEEEEAEHPVLPLENIVLFNGTSWRCADIPGDEPRQADLVVQHDCDTARDQQRWDLEIIFPGYAPGEEPLFLIRNSQFGFCFDLPGEDAGIVGTGVFQYRCLPTTADNQLWWLEPADDTLWYIRNFASNDLCLTVAGDDPGARGARIAIAECDDAHYTKWGILDPDTDIVHAPVPLA
ncbi:ricin-type beta-trefoil lectin domain protein [Streptomyces carpaticus]|uniref:Ricin-type beta-trefoil lectin domain protein n=1 Tax=Streptomyces carpaticus TaxID=285558 RepID=A0ABV4ZTH3_9ACTN